MSLNLRSLSILIAASELRRVSRHSMELHPQPRPYRRSGQPREEDQGPRMLGLNRRLETYLGRVRQLEGENQSLCRELQGLRRSQQEAWCGRPSLDEQLRQVRAEVEVAWRERERVELEASCLAQELRDLGQQRQRVAEARLEAQAGLEDCTREMEEEQSARAWLCEEVARLEQEIHF
ncbi:hypothetical protein CRUP_000930 [Coryphaenoides rupestris]|nr:hypothetical protein CRUP_000930 [Coryphaenoides rupestris]